MASVILREICLNYSNMYPKEFNDLIVQLKKLPQLGNKAAERYAFTLLNMNEEEINNFVAAIKKANANIKKCEQCNFLTNNDYCEMCHDPSRDKSILCVVLSPKDVIAMEKTQKYNGRYYVLEKEISPSKGIMPMDLSLDKLLGQLNDVKEVILALSSTIDGETTSLYLSKILSNYPLKVSKIASGIPMGAQFDYADELTIIKALEGRSEIK
ncbi:MAG: recombination mediator RecR [Erysipelotrichaceae bacterium]